MNTQSIPEEVIFLLEHIQLNESDWWDKSVQRLIIGIVWHSKKRLDSQGLVHEIKSLLGIKLSLSKIEDNINKLCKNEDLIILHDRALKIPEKRLERFSSELDKASQTQEKAKNDFIASLITRTPNLPENRAEEIWGSFNDTLLIPMIQALGAKTYSLISGMQVNSNDIPAFREYIEKQPTILQDAIRDSILEFMDVNNPSVRSIIIRHLNASFFVGASQLKEKTLRKINEILEGKPVFKIFLDTNFLFSLLDMHDNPSNEAALSLMNLIETISEYAEVSLYVYPLTIDEAKAVIKRALRTCKGINFHDNITDAVLSTEVELTGMIRRYAQERKKSGITPDDYFAPYILQLMEMIALKGVNVYDQDVEILRNNQVIKGEIEYQQDLQSKHPDRKQKSYLTIEHDVVFWYFIKKLRPARVENPIKAEFWISTIDFGLLGYDAHKRKHSPEELPVCLHPTALIHMLQFWVPRDEVFEKAILGSFRLPFLFQAFDEKDEIITANLLTTISSLQNSDKLSAKMMTSLLVNKALRNKIADAQDINEQINAIKETIETEEANLRNEIEALNETRKLGEEKQRELLGAIARKDVELIEAEIKENELRQKILELEQEKNVDKERRSFTTKWVLVPLAVNIFVSILLNLYNGFLFESTWKPVYAFIFFTSGLFIHTLVVDRVGRKNNLITSWKYFMQFHNVKTWIIGSLSILVGGLITDALYDIIKAKYLEYISTLPK